MDNKMKDLVSNKHKIYFVERIVILGNGSSQDRIKCLLVLLEASVKSNLLSEEDNYDYRVVKSTLDRISGIHEGQYVFVDIKENIFENANKTVIAKRNFRFNNYFRGKLLKKQIEKNKEYEHVRLESKVHIFSYHINVGHGNCSIIVIKGQKKTKIWMVDCSDFDYMNKMSYQEHLDVCFKHIKDKFSLQKVVIDKFFLTHTHYDHYSGISRLIDLKMLTAKTIFYLNLHYSMASENYNRLLQKINKLNPIIIEPLSTVQSSDIEIWHPDKRTIRSATAKYAGQNVNIESNVNNSSVVYCFKYGEQKILFPGDLGTKKWNTIDRCSYYLQSANYFVISHHGSLTGHLRTSCPVDNNIVDLSYCVARDSTQILMGRDSAYPGIYSKRVIADFNNLIYSEKNMNSQPCKFLEIDWKTNEKVWIL